MKKIFFDDFAANTIDNYKLEGNVNVQWEEGRLKPTEIILMIKMIWLYIMVITEIVLYPQE